MRKLDSAACGDFDMVARREWLETNGIGGFASSTVAGLNTRRYHGLLVAATKPPLGRMVLLSKVEETLVIGGRRFELSCNRYPGVIHPQGYRYLKEFRQDPFPVFVYDVEGVELVKSTFLVHGENTVVIEYQLRGNAECALELRPLIAFRDYHSTTHENGALNPSLVVEPGQVTCAPYPDCPCLCFGHTAGKVQQGSGWYRNFEYAVEQERGLDYREDLFNPFVLTLDLGASSKAALIASPERHDGADAGALRDAEVSRRSAVSAGDSFVDALAVAADQFIVKRGDGATIIAGYPWFSDWGRDTMIALPGLTLATGRFDDARSILLAFGASADRGMLPNRFPDAGETPEYNTVDATLWFFEAVRAFAAHTGDFEFVRTKLYETLTGIVDWHERGTRYGIRLDEDGLLLAGEPGVQLTWMDAKVGDWVVTPRHGKPVEVQALWYHALRVMEELAARFGDAARAIHYGEVADRARESFNAIFRNESSGGLYDVVGPQGPDAAVRPNQIFAVSLRHSMLSGDAARGVVGVVQRELLTPYGLRSLSPRDPQYSGRYEGGPSQRDSRYHQGTVWPWLLGPFVSAYLRVHEHSAPAREQVQAWLAGIHGYLEQEGMGQLPEVFDGDAPQRAGGCFAQAWSVAELLRVLAEDVGTIPASSRIASVQSEFSKNGAQGNEEAVVFVCAAGPLAGER